MDLTLPPMKNKIYQECREEALNIICEKNKKEPPIFIYILKADELDQLTAEIYAQKFADWIQPMDRNKEYYSCSKRGWHQYHVAIIASTPIGTTAQLHEKFVEENKGGENENN